MDESYFFDDSLMKFIVLIKSILRISSARPPGEQV